VRAWFKARYFITFACYGNTSTVRRSTVLWALRKLAAITVGTYWQHIRMSSTPSLYVVEEQGEPMAVFAAEAPRTAQLKITVWRATLAAPQISP